MKGFEKCFLHSFLPPFLGMLLLVPSPVFTCGVDEMLREILWLIVFAFPYFLYMKTNMTLIQMGFCERQNYSSLRKRAGCFQPDKPSTILHMWDIVPGDHEAWAVATLDHTIRQSCCVGLQMRSIALRVWPKKWCTCSSSTKLPLLSFSVSQHCMPWIGPTNPVWGVGAQSQGKVTVLCCKWVTCRPQSKSVRGSRYLCALCAVLETEQV